MQLALNQTLILTLGADWPLVAPGRFPVAWRLIWPVAQFSFFCLPNVPKWSFPIEAFSIK